MRMWCKHASVLCFQSTAHTHTHTRARGSLERRLRVYEFESIYEESKNTASDKAANIAIAELLSVDNCTA